jgi:hypothetical protein
MPREDLSKAVGTTYRLWADAQNLLLPIGQGGRNNKPTEPAEVGVNSIVSGQLQYGRFKTPKVTFYETKPPKGEFDHYWLGTFRIGSEQSEIWGAGDWPGGGILMDGQVKMFLQEVFVTFGFGVELAGRTTFYSVTHSDDFLIRKVPNGRWTSNISIKGHEDLDGRTFAMAYNARVTSQPPQSDGWIRIRKNVFNYGQTGAMNPEYDQSFAFEVEDFNFSVGNLGFIKIRNIDPGQGIPVTNISSSSKPVWWLS